MAAKPKGQRIGVAVLRVLASRVLEMVPVYGVYASVGFDVVTAVRDELAKDRPLTLDEIARSLRAVTPEEAAEVIDRALESPEGVQALSALPVADCDAVRRRLLRLPSEIEAILHELELEEKERAQQAAEEARLAAERHAREQRERVWALEQQLKKHLNARDLEGASRVVESILALDAHHRDALNAQRWLEKRLDKTIRHDAWVGAGVGAVPAILLFPSASSWQGALVCCGFIIAGAIVGAIYGAWRRIRRWNKLR